MNRRDDLTKRGVDHFAALLGHAKLPAEQRLCRGGTQTDDELWLDRFDLGFQPWPAGGDFATGGLGMDAPHPARLKFEMLDRVRHVRHLAVDSRLFERLVKKFASRPHKWLARSIFLVARGFANEHEGRSRGSLSENDLGCVAMKGAASAFLGSLAQDGQRAGLGQVLGG